MVHKHSKSRRSQHTILKQKREDVIQGQKKYKGKEREIALKKIRKIEPLNLVESQDKLYKKAHLTISLPKKKRP